MSFPTGLFIFDMNHGHTLSHLEQVAPIRDVRDDRVDEQYADPSTGQHATDPSLLAQRAGLDCSDGVPARR